VVVVCVVLVWCRCGGVVLLWFVASCVVSVWCLWCGGVVVLWCVVCVVCGGMFGDLGHVLMRAYGAPETLNPKRKLTRSQP
jgi:hypothetical protein